jgi:hypothetical protein
MTDYQQSDKYEDYAHYTKHITKLIFRTSYTKLRINYEGGYFKLFRQRIFTRSVKNGVTQSIGSSDMLQHRERFTEFLHSFLMLNKVKDITITSGGRVLMELYFC